MGTLVSPGVSITETDRTDALTQVATTEGALAGNFTWGPVEKVQTVSSEAQLVAQFGKPDTNSAPYFFTAANFLAYSNTLRVVRAVDSDQALAATTEAKDTILTATETFTAESGNATITAVGGNVSSLYVGLTLDIANSTSNTITVTIKTINSTSGTAVVTVAPTDSVTAGNAYPYGLWVKNADHYAEDATINGGLSTAGAWTAKYVGALGNSLRVETCASANAFKQDTYLSSGTPVYAANANSVITANITASASNTTLTFAANVAAMIQVGDILTVNAAGTLEEREIISIANNTTAVVNAAFSAALTSKPFNRRWKYAKLFTAAPGTSSFASDRGGANDEIHVVVVDAGGAFTGTPGTVLERYQGLSKASDAVTENGASNFYKEVINVQSPYIWWTNHLPSTTNWGESATTTFTTLSVVSRVVLRGGTDGGTLSAADLQAAYVLLADEQVSASFIMGANANTSMANYIISNVVEPKRYSIGFFSPNYSDVVNVSSTQALQNVLAYRNALPSTSYAVMDSGWKQMYDKYNKVYRYVPLNGDIAGLAARTDQVAESWFSPAGFTRGGLKIGNTLKLAFNPTQSQRDDLYLAGVNPVVSFPGEGTVLYGDKTLLRKPSAFDRINVRRLFIELEKTVERSAKYQLFEQNDEFTRSMFVNMIEPYLRSVKGRRGISDFFVVCDATNNPADAIARGEFRADIYVKPVRSINFINLNFVAVRSDVTFSEVITNLS